MPQSHAEEEDAEQRISFAAVCRRKRWGWLQSCALQDGKKDLRWPGSESSLAGSRGSRLPQTLALSVTQGIWRIPVDEIDRPGSFAWHMNRSIVLLLKVLAQLRDHSTLLKVSSMLQRTPDQGK